MRIVTANNVSLKAAKREGFQKKNAIKHGLLDNKSTLDVIQRRLDVRGGHETLLQFAVDASHPRPTVSLVHFDHVEFLHLRHGDATFASSWKKSMSI